MNHADRGITPRKSIGRALTYRDAARSHVHGLDDFEAWIAQVERGLTGGGVMSAQQASNVRFAIETLDALRARLVTLSQLAKHKVRR